MLDRGATMSLKHPMTIQTYLNIKSPSHIVDVVNKALDNHGYAHFINIKLDDTTQDAFVYKADE